MPAHMKSSNSQAPIAVIGIDIGKNVKFVPTIASPVLEVQPPRFAHKEHFRKRPDPA